MERPVGIAGDILTLWARLPIGLALGLVFTLFTKWADIDYLAVSLTVTLVLSFLVGIGIAIAAAHCWHQFLEIAGAVLGKETSSVRDSFAGILSLIGLAGFAGLFIVSFWAVRWALF